MLINIDIPENMKQELQEKAKKLGTSMSYIVKDALYRYLKED